MSIAGNVPIGDYRHNTAPRQNGKRASSDPSKPLAKRRLLLLAGFGQHGDHIGLFQACYLKAARAGFLHQGCRWLS